MSFVVIIPARFGSSRFPGKPLADIKGKPMIAHVIDRAFEAGASQVVVATDDERIRQTVGERCTVCMTRSDHNSGTERLAEVVQTLKLHKDTIVVNVQGDEPFVPAENIQQVAANLADRPDIPMATLATPFDNADDVSNPNMVKVIANQHQEAIYFSRSAIPFDRAAMLERTESLEPGGYLRHIGIYAYRASYITRYVEYPSTVLEQLESLEQLRALWYGDKIHVDVAVAAPPVGIDTPEDLAHLLSIL